MIEFVRSLTVTQWMLVALLFATLILVALAAAVWANPVNLARRPTPLPDHPPDWVTASVHPRPVSEPERDVYGAPIGYQGRHCLEDRTVNLRDYMDRLGP